MCKFNYVSKIGHNLLAGAQLNHMVIFLVLIMIITKYDNLEYHSD